MRVDLVVELDTEAWEIEEAFRKEAIWFRESLVVMTCRWLVPGPWLGMDGMVEGCEIWGWE